MSQERTIGQDGQLSEILLAKETTETLYKDRPPLPEELQINMRWQWDDNLDSCRDALFYLVVLNQPRNALAVLQSGQQHNQHVVELYAAGFNTLANFWDLLVSSHTWVPDFGELQINLEWQYHNNIDSLAKAWQHFSAGRNVPGMYYLMDGQRHNRNVMNLYRACYAANAPRLIEAIKKLIVGKAEPPAAG